MGVAKSVFGFPLATAVSGQRYKQDTMITYVSLCRESKGILVKPCQLTVD